MNYFYLFGGFWLNYMVVLSFSFDMLNVSLKLTSKIIQENVISFLGVIIFDFIGI